jgi:hypothetical protein
MLWAQLVIFEIQKQVTNLTAGIQGIGRNLIEDELAIVLFVPFLQGNRNDFSVHQNRSPVSARQVLVDGQNARVRCLGGFSKQLSDVLHIESKLLFPVLEVTQNIILSPTPLEIGAGEN